MVIAVAYGLELSHVTNHIYDLSSVLLTDTVQTTTTSADHEHTHRSWVSSKVC